jgi:Domain of unknown function (DUF5753)
MMRAQLLHLARVTSVMPHVTIQVIPLAHGGCAGAGGPFSILRFGDWELPDVVYIEQLTSALYLDRRRDIEHYLEVLEALSLCALSPSATTNFILQVARET